MLCELMAKVKFEPRNSQSIAQLLSHTTPAGAEKQLLHHGSGAFRFTEF